MDYGDKIELIKDYVEDTIEFLDSFETQLLSMEQSERGKPETDELAEILSALHTFKGNSGMMGYASIQKYSHKLEDIFKAVQNEKVDYTSELAEFLFEAINVIRRAIQNISPENPGDPNIEQDVAELEDFIARMIKTTSTAPSSGVSSIREINQFAKKTNLLKVDFERLDHLMNLMGELVIHRTRLGRIEGQIKEFIGEKGLSLELTDTAEQLGKITTELHEAIMKVRMLPLKYVFRRFPRFIRDMSHEKGKEINFQFEGEETELDKTVIDEIGEPLLHLLRNAVDHGIEKPEEREALGKPRQGNIFIKAYQESSHIMISVEDDGKGIDKARLKEKAEKAGLLQKDDLSQRNLLDLIFLPGLSTAEKVTEVSGRGLGMDVVKKSLAKINGSIEVESEINVGSRFDIKLPLTLAIISALMVKVSNEQYAIPLASVVESIKISKDEIHLVNDREVVYVREKVMPLLRLSALFNLPVSTNGKNVYSVIVQSTLGKMGIIVDSLLGQHEIVIKALDEYIGDSEGIAGATILGDGRVVLIVDVFELMEKVRQHGTPSENVEARYA